MASDDPEFSHTVATRWFVRGLACLFTVPALVLMSAFAGFAGFARESGFTLVQCEFMIVMIWALPSKIVLAGAVASNTGLVATFIAVALSSIRLMPMTMAIVPEMRTAETRRWVLYLLSHFVAVTGWVMALERFKTVPREFRTAFYAGLVITLLLSNLAVTAFVYITAADMPPFASAALVFVTPLYFLFSLWGSAKDRSIHVALVLGLVLTPLFHEWFSNGDVLATGLVGGIAAHFVSRRSKRAQG